MAVRGGIDLGTTYSAISLYEATGNRVDTIDLDTADGAKMLRSVVYFPPGGGAAVVGESAWNAAVEHPDRVITGIKRSMGTDYRTPELDGKAHSAPEVSAHILRTVRDDARKYLGEDVRDVVITVPAHFGDAERAATEEAGKLAGFNVLQLLSEPQAAAYGYAVERAAEVLDRYLAVFDLGGGTLDVTLVRPYLDGQTLQVDTLAKEGDPQLGGLDWDKELAQLVSGKVKAEHGLELLDDPAASALLLDNCEKGKRHLSRRTSYLIVADRAGHQVEVTVAEFEAATSHLLVRAEASLEKVLTEAKDKSGNPIPRESIEVLLAGGSTKMPMVRDMVTRVIGRPPKMYGNPELLVTVGAAYWAHLCSEGATVPVAVPQPDGTVVRQDVQGGLTDITAHAVGVRVLRSDGSGGWRPANAVIVPSAAAFGKDFKKEFQTSEDGMTEIEVILYKGEDADVDRVERLMTFTIGGLPPGRAAGQRVEVTLQFDASGVLRGSAVDLATKKSCDILIERSPASSA